MGWKNVKEHYRIGHQVRVTNGVIQIGSAHIPEIISISPNGKITLQAEPAPSCNEELQRYLDEMHADPAKLRELIDAPDTFKASIPVYTYEGGNVIQLRCEQLGYPNPCHDGTMQFDNMHFPTPEEAAQEALSNYDAGIELQQYRLNELAKEQEQILDRLEQYRTARTQLQASYPDVTSV